MTVRRHSALTGLLGILMVLLATAAGFSFTSLPFFGAGNTYTAEFSEAAGLEKGNEVRVAGVKVGQVTGVDLDGDRVLVDFQVSDTWVGDQSRAGIEIKTLLGSKFLSLDPAGDKRADPDHVIPLSRTAAPYDVLEAFSDAGESLDVIDSDQLAESLTVLSDTFSETPEHIRGALDGVARLSRTVADRDDEVRALLEGTGEVSTILADRNIEFQELLTQSGLLLTELNNRRDAISRVLTQSQEVSRQIRGIIDDNAEQIGPMLTELDRVVSVMVEHRDDIDKALEQGAVFYRLFNNSFGNGRWWDTTVGNLLPPQFPEIPSDRPALTSLTPGGD